MPLYEYVCPTCKVRFARLRAMDDGGSSACPDCDTSAVRALSLFASPVRATALADGPALGGAGCCGGGCGCHSA